MARQKKTRTPKAKPNVAILHYSSPPVIGGVEFIIHAHAHQFAKAGYNVRLIVGRGGPLRHPHVHTEVIPEIGSRGGPISSVIRALDRGEVPRSFSAAVKRVEKRLAVALRGIDVCMVHNVMTIHFNLVLTAALAGLMKRQKSTRFIGWTHDLTFADPVHESHQHRRYPWSMLSQPQPGCNYCAISVQRQIEMRHLFRVRAAQVPVIPDGIDVAGQLDLTAPVARLFEQEHLAAVDIIALTPARILRRKNLGVGMEIVAALKKQGKSVRWMITGAPDPHNPASMKYYRMLISLRRRLRIKDEVIFLCERFEHGVSNPDLRSLYELSDILLFPSDREGFGLPVLEAGLFGLLVVISDIPALRALAKRNAVYIHLGDSSEMIARNIVQAVKKRPELVYRKHVISTYSWEVVFAERILPAVLRPESVWTALRQGGD